MLQRQTSSGTTFGYGKSSGMSVQDSFSMKDYDAVKDVINNMPTSYDPDKVVEKLEKRRMDALRHLRENKGTEFGYASECVYNALNEAVEIVKGGGVDE